QHNLGTQHARHDHLPLTTRKLCEERMMPDPERFCEFRSGPVRVPWFGESSYASISMRRVFGMGGFATRRLGLCGALVVPAMLAACGGGATRSSTSLVGIHKIEHVIVIMQENRSFDDYFGTFPG